MNFIDSATGNRDRSKKLREEAERNAALYAMLNALDDRRERMNAIMSQGPHEPVHAYGGLYHVDDLDAGGDLVERRERGIGGQFVPVHELPQRAKLHHAAPTGKKPVDAKPTRAVRDDRPLVFVRRDGILRAA